MRHPHPLRLVAPIAGMLLGATAEAQNTQPHLSTFFGGTARDEIVSVHADANGVVTVLGITDSADLPATGNAAQAVHGGSYDAFVARLDTRLAGANQLLWCTYLGGSGRDYAFDLAVDPMSGVITVVGSTESPDFPGATGRPTQAPNGVCDGFVVQLDVSGSLFLGAMLVGGSGPDRVTEVELRGGDVIIAGVTESSDLPWTAGTAFPNAFGGTDAFAAKVDPMMGQGSWATYLGGDGLDGLVYQAIVANGGWPNVWEGYLVKMGLAVGPAGEIAVATVSNLGAVPAATTAGAVQANHRGSADVYLAVLDPTGTTLQYGTFYGGTDYEAPMAIAAHPAGGFVMGGYTFSYNLPVTTGCIQSTFQPAGTVGIGADDDGWLCHIDPALGANGLRYGTYLGGNVGEDTVSDIAVESSGLVTVAGWTCGGSFPLTARSVFDTPGARSYHAMIARIDMAGRGADDVYYAARLSDGPFGSAGWLDGVHLDERGDAWVVGSLQIASFATTNAYQSTLAGDYDGILMHVPLLPGCVGRSDVALASPACAGPLYTGVGGAPIPGTTFRVTATGAPPGALGFYGLGTASPPLPLPAPFNASVLVLPDTFGAVTSDALGAAHVDLPVPSGLPPACPWSLAVQWLFFTNAACPGSGQIATSGRLDL